MSILNAKELDECERLLSNAERRGWTVKFACLAAVLAGAALVTAQVRRPVADLVQTRALQVRSENKCLVSCSIEKGKFVMTTSKDGAVPTTVFAEDSFSFGKFVALASNGVRSVAIAETQGLDAGFEIGLANGSTGVSVTTTESRVGSVSVNNEHGVLSSELVGSVSNSGVAAVFDDLGKELERLKK